MTVGTIRQLLANLPADYDGCEVLMYTPEGIYRLNVVVAPSLTDAREGRGKLELHSAKRSEPESAAVARGFGSMMADAIASFG